jgi:hypothetical protein
MLLVQNVLLLFFGFNAVLGVFIGIFWCLSKDDEGWSLFKPNWKYIFKFETMILGVMTLFGLLSLIPWLRNHQFIFVLLIFGITLLLRALLNRMAEKKRKK